MRVATLPTPEYIPLLLTKFHHSWVNEVLIDLLYCKASCAPQMEPILSKYLSAELFYDFLIILSHLFFCLYRPYYLCFFKKTKFSKRSHIISHAFAAANVGVLSVGSAACLLYRIISNRWVIHWKMLKTKYFSLQYKAIVHLQDMIVRNICIRSFHTDV